jgi:hypothetical protein
VPLLHERLAQVQDHFAEHGGARHGGGHHPAAVPFRRGEERGDRLAAVQLDRLVLGRRQVGGQHGQFAEGTGGQSQGHPFGIFLVRKATVDERLAQHGNDTLPIAIGRPEIPGRAALGHARKDTFCA